MSYGLDVFAAKAIDAIVVPAGLASIDAILDTYT
jgi:hypothetical protein